MLAFKPAQGTLLTVLLIICMEASQCTILQVDPPEEIKIIDPGHLGRMEITWTLPASLIHIQECPTLYQLEYFNAYMQRWDVIKTPHRTYSAQFDLMKDIQVRVYTLLGEHCANNTWVKSQNYTELVQKPPREGPRAVNNFDCVFYNMERLNCMWRNYHKLPSNAQIYLYYWHKELEQIEECPEYLFMNGVRSGCSLTGKPLPDFTDVNFCVNGSSPEGPLRPTYKSLQIQNNVKPDPAEKLTLQQDHDTQIKLHWKKPSGNVPEHCLIWEVEHTSKESQKEHSEQIYTTHTSLILPAVAERNCFRVRSKLCKYCVARSFWSEWSQQRCI
ncbi:interleukin-13 receptor subunit alpha-2 isoform X1 [Syngnathus acus]|uniref:interleukin-13 receptor subunit alpha-2 isoform X1 n=1 Tax=Syngnathus acus TaxID=161584 RepID=UPI001885F948|nr:interleukin-13 receptor subunit alpha-2 isoform X1 [Syngnathus acus]XP_037126326.1 interleukin-13 receptor subunit alpha-2 isoform X1 [Syngnathus acus]